MILYGLIQKDMISEEKRERILTLFLNNLQEGHNYEPELEEAIERTFSETNTYQIFKQKFLEFYERGYNKIGKYVHKLVEDKENYIKKKYEQPSKYIEALEILIVEEMQLNFERRDNLN